MNGSYSEVLLDAERSRIDAITHITAGNHAIAATAIRDGWSVDGCSRRFSGTAVLVPRPGS